MSNDTPMVAPFVLFRGLDRGVLTQARAFFRWRIAEDPADATAHKALNLCTTLEDRVAPHFQCTGEERLENVCRALRMLSEHCSAPKELRTPEKTRVS